MLSVTRRSLSLSSSPSPHHVSLRRNVVKLNRKYHAKVSALPFVLSKDDAARHVAPFASVGTGKSFFRSLLAKYLPDFRIEPLQPDDLKAVYIPVWFVDGEVMGKMIKSGTEMSAIIHSLNSCIPGFSSDPLSTLSFSQPRLEELAVPFTPELRNQHGIHISCLPFSISPVPLLEIVESLTPSQAKLPDSTKFDPKSVGFSMLAAYPVLLPIYLMRYDLQLSDAPEVSFICMVQAHSKNALTYTNRGVAIAGLGGAIREITNTTPGSWLHKFSHSMDDVPVWEALHGTSYEFSSIGIPTTHPALDSFNKAISTWADEKIQSESNMATLAEYGVDMDHPCVRVYTKKEVDANRTFLAASAESFQMHNFSKKAEKIKSGEIKLKVTGGKLVGSPEVLLELMERKKFAMDKEKDGLKPQWLRDWQDSQRRGQSAPS